MVREGELLKSACCIVAVVVMVGCGNADMTRFAPGSEETGAGIGSDAPPHITLLPLDFGAPLSRTVSLRADASDDLGVTRVEFAVDGVAVATVNQGSPYSAGWNTATVHNGAHDVTAKAFDTSGHTTTSRSLRVTTGNALFTPVRTVFIILMENHNWSDIVGDDDAPYIVHTLLPQASHAEQYFNPPSLHPSEPNYLWLEAGTSFGVTNDSDPSRNHQSTSQHLVTQLEKAGLSWKSYQEDIDGKTCPLTSTKHYAPKHNPMVYFDDVTDGNNVHASRCISHVRPYSELAGDLTNGTVPNYVFITPNLCNDMHSWFGCPSWHTIHTGDTWLSREVPKIMSSAAFRSGGALFITWDESEGGEHPIGLIALSPFAKGSGYGNSVPYTHSSLLRTVQQTFGLIPLLGDAANATDLSDLFLPP